MAKIDAFFKLMFDHGASDLHLAAGSQPILRIHGEMERIKYKILENDELKAMLYEIAPEPKIKHFEETGDVDFGYEIPGLARFRANFFQQKWGCGAVFRQIPAKILSFSQLNLPEALKKLWQSQFSIKIQTVISRILRDQNYFFDTSFHQYASFFFKTID